MNTTEGLISSESGSFRACIKLQTIQFDTNESRFSTFSKFTTQASTTVVILATCNIVTAIEPK